jgi:hypothetical protein
MFGTGAFGELPFGTIGAPPSVGPWTITVTGLCEALTNCCDYAACCCICPTPPWCDVLSWPTNASYSFIVSNLNLVNSGYDTNIQAGLISALTPWTGTLSYVTANNSINGFATLQSCPSLPTQNNDNPSLWNPPGYIFNADGYTFAVQPVMYFQCGTEPGVLPGEWWILFYGWNGFIQLGTWSPSISDQFGYPQIQLLQLNSSGFPITQTITLYDFNNDSVDVNIVGNVSAKLIVPVRRKPRIKVRFSKKPKKPIFV